MDILANNYRVYTILDIVTVWCIQSQELLSGLCTVQGLCHIFRSESSSKSRNSESVSESVTKKLEISKSLEISMYMINRC